MTVASQPRSSPGCETSKSALRVEVGAGRGTATPTGIEITFVGTGHDDFDDGTFDDWVELRFRRDAEVQSRLVSVYGEHAVDEVLGVCWKLESVGHDQVVITLFPVAVSTD